ncbi:unnamed protein product, partial [Linum tenue]
GLLAAHPVTPLLSLHHIDVITHQPDPPKSQPPPVPPAPHAPDDPRPAGAHAAVHLLRPQTAPDGLRLVGPRRPDRQGHRLPSRDGDARPHLRQLAQESRLQWLRLQHQVRSPDDGGEEAGQEGRRGRRGRRVSMGEGR